MKSPAINQAMDILRQLRHISEGPDTLPVKLDKIITMIVEQMQADAGACYLVVDDNYLELFAASGFNDRIAHKVSLRVGEGLVGELAENCRSLAVAEA